MDLNFTSTKNTDRRRKMAEMFTKPTAVGLLLSRPSPTRLNIQDLESFRTMREAGKGAAGSGPYCTYLWIALTQYCTDTASYGYSIALTRHCTEQIILTQYYTVARSQLHRVRSIASVLHWKSNLRLWQRWQQSPIWDGGRVAECTSGFFHSIQSKPIQVTTRLHWTK